MPEETISKELVVTQLSKKQKHLITDETIDEINKLAEDPDYGPEFLQTYVDHLNVIKVAGRHTPVHYLNAIKFFCLVEADNSLTDAYIKVFPERFEHRSRNETDPKKKKNLMRGEASRYNRSVLLNEIRKVAAIPVQLIHRHVLHEAILTQAELMRSARSEMVRQKAAACLITELKPAEDHTINVNVEDGAKSVIEELRQATEKLAAAEHQSVMAGVPLERISEAKIIDVEVEEVD